MGINRPSDRGICPVCGKFRMVKADGTMNKHRGVEGYGGPPLEPWCRGAGLGPAKPRPLIEVLATPLDARPMGCECIPLSDGSPSYDNPECPVHAL